VTDPYAHIQIRIHAIDQAAGAYPVEATLDDGSHFGGGMLRIDMQYLLTHILDPEGYGLALFYSLFDGPIRRAYDKATGRAEAETEGRLRVRLWIDEGAAELHALPWERLYHPHKGQDVPLVTSTLTPFSRYTGLEIAEAPPVVQRPVQMLFAIANPTSLPKHLAPIDLEAEMESLRQALGDLWVRGELQVTLLPGRTGLSPGLRAGLEAEGYLVHDGPTSLDNILRLLPDCHVFHFLGHGHFKRERTHGTGTAALHLEGEDGSWQAIKDEELVPKLTAIDPPPHLVFLAACQSAKREPEKENPFVGLGPKLVTAGVPAVVAMQDEVPMDLARGLTGDFYRRLLDHGLVDRALNEARNLLFKPNRIDWATPVLFVRLATGQLFAPPEGNATPVIPRKSFEPETVLIPAGPFLMGSQPGEKVPVQETPQHKVNLAAYRIGKYPVTNREYAEFIRQTDRMVAPELGWHGQRPPPAKLDHPVKGVTFFEALDYCEWLSEQTSRSYGLPTEAEWEKAARGTDGRAYPWGDAWESDRCHQGGDDSAPVDAYPPQSPYACFDIVGNVREWTRSLWGERRPNPDPDFRYPWRDDTRNDPTAGRHLRRVCRGGSFVDKRERLRCTARDSNMPNRLGPPYKRLGFRVVLRL
jgi:formylglycine-generating enzyme required for sulfatase activity